MSKKQKTSGGFTSLAASIAVAISLILGIVIYKFIFGDPGNFVDGDPTAEPLEGNFMGIIYKGGIIVPVLVAMNLIVLIFSIERFITMVPSLMSFRTLPKWKKRSRVLLDQMKRWVIESMLILSPSYTSTR